jgi:hypothetical protein
MVGENSRAILNLAHLLQTPYLSGFYAAPITPALSRLRYLFGPVEEGNRVDQRRSSTSAPPTKN